MLPTVTSANPGYCDRLPNALKHPTDVLDDHADVIHTTSDTAAEAECSPRPKLKPDRVKDANPVCGAFIRTSEPTGASKLKIGRPVPPTDPTVTLSVPKMSPKLFDRHPTVVADVHDDVTHTPRSPPPPRDSPAVAVCSPTPKSSPLTVSDAYPL